jgi:hypothetical protein
MKLDLHGVQWQSLVLAVLNSRVLFKKLSSSQRNAMHLVQALSSTAQFDSSKAPNPLMV